MTAEKPNFDDATIARLAKELYGLEGTLKPLVSYEDQNALITTDNGQYVFKIGNKRWSLAGLHMQTEVLNRIKEKAPDLGMSDIIPSLEGKDVTLVDGFPVRLLSFLPGDILHKAKRSAKLYNNLGAFLGKCNKAMMGYEHPEANRYDDIWHLDNIMACKQYLGDVVREEDRDRIERFYALYEKEVQPKLLGLRKSILHNDANEQNFLVDEESQRVTGLIDFADMAYGTLINELAITMAYALLGENDVATAAHDMIKGYHNELPLEDGELDVLFILTAMRLIQSIILTSHHAKLEPDNKYIVISQKPARALLKRFEGEPNLKAAFRL